MASDEIYPKVTESVTTLARKVEDAVYFNILASGTLKGLYAAKNSGKSLCIDAKPLEKCETAMQVMRSTLELIPEDTNDNFTGWVGYERSSVTCEDCGHGCSARVFWKDGIATEQVKFLFYEIPEPDTVIHINSDGYRS